MSAKEGTTFPAVPKNNNNFKQRRQRTHYDPPNVVLGNMVSSRWF